MTDRNYKDTALKVFVSDLDEGEQTMLRVGGALPATFLDLEPQLSNKDVARMIELLKEGDY